MDIRILLLAKSPNQEDQERLNAIVNEARKNPMYLFFLIDQLNSHDVQNIPDLPILITIEIKNIINLFYLDGSLWSPELESQIPSKLIEIISSIKPDQRLLLIECFRTVFRKLKDNIMIGQQISNLYPSFGINNDNILTLLKITHLWAKAYLIHAIRFNYKSEYEGQYEPITISFLEKIVLLLQASIPHIQNNEVACDICRYCAKAASSLFFLIIHKENTTTFETIISLLTPNLSLPVQEKLKSNILLLKRSIAKFISKLIHQFCKINDNIPMQKEFAGHFLSNILPNILQLILSSFETPIDYATKSLFLDCFDAILKHPNIISPFLTPEFISNFVLQSAKLTSDDLDDMENNPNLYIAQNTDHYNKGNTPRIHAFYMIGVFIYNYELVDPISSILLSPSSDYFEFEAKLYLLTSFSKVYRLWKKEIQGERDYDSIIPLDFLQMLLEQINPSMPIFLITTILELLSITLIHTSDDYIISGLNLACSILQSEAPLILHYFAAVLLRKCLENISDDVNFPIDINIVLPPLLNLLKENLNTPTVVYAIKQSISSNGTIKLGPEQSSQLISIMASLVKENLMQGFSCDDYEIKNVLEFLCDFFLEIEDNDLLLHSAINIMPLLIEMLKAPNNSNNEPIWKIISAFCKKLPIVPPEILTLIPLFLSQYCLPDTETDTICCQNLTLLLHIMAPLIISQNNYFISNQEIIVQLKKVLEVSFTKHFHFDQPFSSVQDCASAFLLSGILLQMYGENMTSLLLFGKTQIEKWVELHNEEEEPIDDSESKNLLSSIAFMYAIAFTSQDDSTFKSLNNLEIDFLVHELSDENCETIFASKNFIIILLHLVMHGYALAYHNAAEILVSLEQDRQSEDEELNDNEDSSEENDDVKEEEKEEDDSDENDDDDSDDDDSENDDSDDDVNNPITRSYQIVSDSDSDDEDESFEPIEKFVNFPIELLDYKALFNEVTRSTGLFSNLDSKLQRKIVKIYK